jgi:hypothetical protein
MELFKTRGIPSGTLIICLGLVFSLIRIVILGLVVLIILYRLNVTITPFLASMGIGGLVIPLGAPGYPLQFLCGPQYRWHKAYFNRDPLPHQDARIQRKTRVPKSA